MAVYHTQSPKGLGRHDRKFIQVAADTVAEFHKIHDDLTRALPSNEVYLSKLPYGSAAMTKRGQTALVKVADTTENRNLLKTLGSVDIPDGYFELVKLRLRESFVQKGGPLDENAQHYFRERYKQRRVRLLRSEDKIPYPEDTAEYGPEDTGPNAEYERNRIARLKSLNEWIEDLPSGRNQDLRMELDQHPRALSKYRRAEPEPTEDSHEEDPLQKYLRMTPEERLEWASKPENKFLAWKFDKQLQGQLQSLD